MKELRDESALMCYTLMQQVKERQYDIIATIWEYLGLDNSQILRNSNADLAYKISPTEVILANIAQTIATLSDKELDDGQSKIIDLFQNLMQKQYKNVVKECEKLKEICEKGSAKECENGFYKFLYYKKLPKVKDIERMNADEALDFASNADFPSSFIYRFFLIKYMNVDESKSKYSRLITVLMDCCVLDSLLDESHCDDTEYCFNNDEIIINSHTFFRYATKRFVELEEYIEKEYGYESNDADELCDVIQEICKSHANSLYTTVSHHPHEVATLCARDIFVAHNEPSAWYNMLTNDGKNGYKNALNYQPDVSRILVSYIRSLAKVESIRYEKKNNGEKMPKLYLTRDVKPSPREMLMNISYAYNMDVIFHLYEIVMEDYYKNFSFENLLKKGAYIRPQSIISELEDKLKAVQDELDREKERYAQSQKQLIEKYSDNDRFVSYERQISKLNKAVDEKDAEIESLKQQLRSQEEFADLINREDDELDADKKVDMDLLKSKRYLFVGNVERHLPDLKKEFPGSVFMDTRNTNIANIKVDGVVLLTKFMGHPMYYKLRNAKEIRDLKWVYCNTKNLDVLHQKMMELV